MTTCRSMTGHSFSRTDRRACILAAALCGGSSQIGRSGADSLGQDTRGPMQLPAPKKRRALRMSERHVAAVARTVPDPGIQVFVGRRAATDDDYDAMTT